MKKTPLVLTSFFLFATAAGAEQPPSTEHLATARRILREVPLVDGHNDIPWSIRERVGMRLSEVDLAADLSTKAFPNEPRPLQTDIPRLRAGGIGAQFWSVYVPAESTGTTAVQETIEQIDMAKRIVARWPEAFELALTASDVERIHRKGRIASLIGMEGGHSINNSLPVLRQMYALGTRYLTLTHSANNDWADAGTADPEHDGLTPFGVEVVREMNRLGMIVDLSHVSATTMHDALDVSSAPVIFSHSGVRALNDYPRNVPDDVLKRLPQNGGVIMITFVPTFVSAERMAWDAAKKAEEARLAILRSGEPQRLKADLAAWEAGHPQPVVTVAQVADHIDHVRSLIGVEHIGLGSDFDGIRTAPQGLQDVSGFPNLLAELLRRGYSESDVKKIAGLNALRVMKKVEAVAAALRQERGPSEASVPAASIK